MLDRIAPTCVLFLAAGAPPAVAQHGPGRAPGAEKIEIPAAGTALVMQDFGGRPVIDVLLDGHGPYRFILDTGAHVSVVDQALSEELALPLAVGVQAATPHGEPAPPIVTLGELRLGDTTLNGVIAAVLPLQRLLNQQAEAKDIPRGVLSAALFPGYLVAFDYPKKRITLTKGELEATDPETVFPYPASDALPTVPIVVAGHETRVHLDTGASDGLTLPARFLTELPLASQPEPAGKTKTLLGEASRSKARVNGTIELGRYTLDVTEVCFSDVTPGQGPPVGQIGYEVLRHFVVTLDSKNRLLRFEQ